jgi:hypothetical protein
MVVGEVLFIYPLSILDRVFLGIPLNGLIPLRVLACDASVVFTKGG